jgi:hypothetical protein
MALIYTYPRLTTIANDDLFLITDVDGSNTSVKPTKSVTFAAIKQAIAGSVTANYIPVSDGNVFVDSVMFQEPGTVYNTTKNVVIAGNIYQSDMANSVSIGQNALQSANNPTGENIAIGLDSLKTLTTGTNNVAIGSLTLSSAGGSTPNNVAISKNALINLTGGIGNISLGFNSGSSIATGNRNIIVGHVAAQFTNGVTSWVDNVILGASAFAGGTLNNNVARGNIAIGDSALTNINSAGTLSNLVMIGKEAGRDIKGNPIADIGIGNRVYYGNNNGFDSSGRNIAIGISAQGNNAQASIEGSIKIGSDTGQAGNNAVNVSTVNNNIGQANNALGSHSALIGGYNNSVNGQAGFIGAGHDNIVSANATGGAILGGYDNIINGTGSAGMALGSDLIVDGNNQVVVGRYNESNNNTKFVVGCGSSNAARQNGFEVLNTGQLRATFYGGSNFPAPGNYKFLVAGSTGNILQVDDSVIEEIELNATNISRDIGTQFFTGPTPPLNIKFTRLAGGPGTIEVVINSSFPTNRLIKFISDGSFAANEGLLIRAAGGENINGQANKTVLGPYKTVQLWFDGSEYFVLYEN